MSVVAGLAVCASLPWWCPRLARWIASGQTAREEAWKSQEIEAWRRCHERVKETLG